MPENMQDTEDFIGEETTETTAASAASSDEDHEPPNNECQEEEKVETVEMKLSRKKALLQFRTKLEEAINGNLLLKKPEDTKVGLEDVSLWGVPLMPSKAHEGTDIVLMKFLRARDFRVSEAFEMLQNTLKWRDENKIDEILNEDFSPDLEKLVIINGSVKFNQLRR